MPAIRAAFDVIAANPLVEHQAFNHGEQNGPYFNFTFGTPRAGELWKLIRTALYDNADLGTHMRKASMAMCSSDEGWDDYLLLYHFDPQVTLDPEAALGS